MSILEFATNVDIGNRACQFVSDFRLNSFNDASPQAREIAFAYDKLRVAELQRIVWKFATRRAILRPIDATTMMLVPAQWSATTQYVPGSIVAYNGLISVSLAWPSIGVTPDTPPLWAPYFGPMTITPWINPNVSSNATATVGAYFAGELVYYPTAENATVYVSLQNSNIDTPGAFPNWDPTIAYNHGDTVIYPASGQLLSVPGNIPVFSTGNIAVNSIATGPWQSTRDLNLNIIPGFEGSWTLVSSTRQSDFRTGQNWLQLDAGFQSLNLIYPVGTGPSTQSTTRNVYRLPNGYLKHAPDIQNPNQIMRVMGVVAQAPSDAQFENGYMVTSEVQAIMLRFVADMTDVTLMDNLFCEGLAARIALDVGPTIVPKEERMQAFARVAKRYRDVISDARANDAIERGASAQPQSQYVSVRT